MSLYSNFNWPCKTLQSWYGPFRKCVLRMFYKTLTGEAFSFPFSCFSLNWNAIIKYTLKSVKDLILIFNNREIHQDWKCRLALLFTCNSSRGISRWARIDPLWAQAFSHNIKWFKVGTPSIFQNHNSLWVFGKTIAVLKIIIIKKE